MPGHASCRTVILLGIFFLLLHACMHSKKTEIDGDLSHSKKTEIDAALSHSNQYLSAGDYQKAIDTLRTAHAKYPEDKPLLRSYQKAVEELKGSADRAFDREEFVSAGRSYRLLLRNYQHFRDFAQQLSFDKKYLNARVTYCSEYLFKRGVGEYRSGDIKHAISTWEGLLSFDPGNAEAEKAYNVATTQLKNLQQKK
jgi:tetratricopeptide (TPR) repeat protein